MKGREEEEIREEKGENKKIIRNGKNSEFSNVPRGYEHFCFFLKEGVKISLPLG